METAAKQGICHPDSAAGRAVQERTCDLLAEHGISKPACASRATETAVVCFILAARQLLPAPSALRLQTAALARDVGTTEAAVSDARAAMRGIKMFVLPADIAYLAEKYNNRDNNPLDAAQLARLSRECARIADEMNGKREPPQPLPDYMIQSRKLSARIQDAAKISFGMGLRPTQKK